MTSQPTVLVDNCIRSTGYSDPAQWEQIEIQLGPLKLGNPLLVYKVKQFKQDQRIMMAAIQAISNHAEQKHINLYTYSELEWELWRGYHSVRTNLTPFAAFQHNEFFEVPSPIERIKFFQTADWTIGEEVEKFIDWLLKVDVQRFCNMLNQANAYTNFERLCATKLDLFKKMCAESVFGRNKARDAYHYWTAECNGLDYFLTVDLKFINAYKNAIKDKKLLTKCKAISPTELVKSLNIPNSPNSIPACGKMFLLNGGEYQG